MVAHYTMAQASHKTYTLGRVKPISSCLQAFLTTKSSLSGVVLSVYTSPKVYKDIVGKVIPGKMISRQSGNELFDCGSTKFDTIIYISDHELVGYTVFSGIQGTSGNTKISIESVIGLGEQGGVSIIYDLPSNVTVKDVADLYLTDDPDIDIERKSRYTSSVTDMVNSGSEKSIILNYGTVNGSAWYDLRNLVHGKSIDTVYNKFDTRSISSYKDEPHLHSWSSTDGTYAIQSLLKLSRDGNSLRVVSFGQVPLEGGETVVWGCCGHFRTSNGRVYSSVSSEFLLESDQGIVFDEYTGKAVFVDLKDVDITTRYCPELFATHYFSIRQEAPKDLKVIRKIGPWFMMTSGGKTIVSNYLTTITYGAGESAMFLNNKAVVILSGSDMIKYNRPGSTDRATLFSGGMIRKRPGVITIGNGTREYEVASVGDEILGTWLQKFTKGSLLQTVSKSILAYQGVLYSVSDRSGVKIISTV